MSLDVSERYFERHCNQAEIEFAPELRKSSGPPTPEPLCDLLGSLTAFIRRCVVLTATQADAAALWILHTHAFEAAETTPYLSISSPEKRSGKSRLLEVLDLLVANPLRAAGTSEAALFRAIAERRPTLLMDEVDAIFGAKPRDGREDLRALLNAGWRQGSPILRCVGDGSRQRVEEFDVFCPKALAGIGRLPDTVADRSIPLVLKRKAAGEQVEPFRRRQAEHAATGLREQIVAWADVSLNLLREARPSLPPQLDDRAADGWEPLLAIADLAGPEWAERARQSALALSVGEEREDPSLGVGLLADIRRVFERRQAERLATAELIGELAADEEAPWGDWRAGGGNISPRALASLLKPYRIHSRSIRLDSGETPKGYTREQFEDAWRRYLPVEGLPAATTPQPASLSDAAPSPIRHRQGLVALAGKPETPHGEGDVADVADGTPVQGSLRSPSDAELRRLLERHRPELVGREHITTVAERREIALLLVAQERANTGRELRDWQELVAEGSAGWQAANGANESGDEGAAAR